MAKLVIVPTPIGNLEDITLRAIKVLKECDFILAEDTRTSSVLLKHFEISKQAMSYHKFNEHRATAHLIEKIQSAGIVALISDAGTPSISDPGFLLVRECIRAGVEVECLPGPTALIPALVASGLPSDRFYFEGFIPRAKGRKTCLEEIAAMDRTIILYEAPYRLVKTLEDMILYFGATRPAAVCRELSKMHEEITRGSLAEILEYYKNRNIKGEIVIVAGGKSYGEKLELRKEQDEQEDQDEQ